MHHGDTNARGDAELEVLHAGLGLLMARYATTAQPSCTALWISRQLRLIADHPDLPDSGLRPLYRTMDARWHIRAWGRLQGSYAAGSSAMTDRPSGHGVTPVLD